MIDKFKKFKVTVTLTRDRINSIGCLVSGHNPIPFGDTFTTGAWQDGEKVKATFTRTKCSRCGKIGSTQTGWE